MTLRWRIGLTLAGLAFVVGAFAAGASYITTASELRRGIDDTLRSRAFAVNIDASGRIGRDGRDDGPDDGNVNGCPSPGSFQPASAAQVVTTDGTVVACIEGGPQLPLTSSDQTLSPGTMVLRTASIGGERYRILSTPWHDGGTLQIARSLGESDSLLRRLRLQLLGLVAAATLVAAGLGWAIATRIARPIVRLRDAAHRIAATLDLTTPVDVGGPGEVGSLADSFSTMVGAVAHSQEQQRRLVSDASHEMRTPLTSLRSNVELLGRIDRLPVDERQDVVSEVLDDIDELSGLLAELVDLASDLAAAEPLERVSLAELANGVAERATRRTGRQVSVDGDASDVDGRPRQLERAISNLVDNAIKYSPGGENVEIAVKAGTVTVRDRGRGMPPDDLPRVFDRFYRAVDVRTEPGSGLGLAIVEEIVRSHAGSVFARNRDGGGAEVGFTIPTA